MNEVFREHLRRYVLVFFDDILVYSRSWEEHLQHVRSVMLLHTHLPLLKGSKLLFERQVDYLGHVIRCTGRYALATVLMGTPICDQNRII